MKIRVYKFGCRRPDDEQRALQLIGQAWLYREDLRQAYNTYARERRADYAANAEAEHVNVYERARYGVHVIAFHRNRTFRTFREELNGRVRDIRSRRGHLLDWGTYQLEEAAALAASKASDLSDIKQQPWDETGRIGCMILSSTAFPAAAWKHPRVVLTEPDARGHANLTIRVGAAKSAMQITWPIKLHRPFPKNSIVKQVAVQRIRLGWRYRWEAIITLGIPDDVEVRDPHAYGTVGIDVGWREEHERGQRISTHESNGTVGSLHIHTREKLLYADEVRGTRDRLFDQAKYYAQDTGIQGCEHAKLWRNKKRLHQIALRRISSGTPDLGLVWWRERDRHLEDIERAAREKSIAQRRHAIREYADSLAKQYEFVALEDMPMTDWLNKGETSELERRRATAALSELQSAIVHRFGDARVDWVPPEYTTMTCAKCGVVRGEPVGRRVYWVCACGHEHHQDVNAAEVIRLRSEGWRGDGNPVRARTRKPKKKEGKKRKAAKVIMRKEDTARVPLSEAAE